MPDRAAAMILALAGTWRLDPARPELREEFGDVTLTITPGGEVLYAMRDRGATMELHAIVVVENGRAWMDAGGGERSPLLLTDDGYLLMDEGVAQAAFVPDR
ncbi:MAG TPA: hypothetical protein VF665_24005 [Longimicrobium sp.]|jgi:hypothetical protein|uniref:hypothetical protein n=1 Tax=Longimicrobium sp. TaxID=2029185 RepID=UPI002ED9103A